MNWMMQALLIVNLALLAVLLRGHLRLRGDLKNALLQLDLAGANAGMNLLPPADGAPMISISILNPMELAAKESALARNFGSLTPDLVRREVYRTVHQRLRQQLVDQGVVAEVTLHHAA